jgi:hypothetical protein
MRTIVRNWSVNGEECEVIICIHLNNQSNYLPLLVGTVIVLFLRAVTLC